MKTAAGKFETYYIDKNTGTAHKVLCRECLWINPVGKMTPIQR